MKRLLQQITVVDAIKNQTLVQEGDYNEEVFIVKEGEFRGLNRFTASGQVDKKKQN